MPLVSRKKKAPKPPPVVELTPEGGENLTPGKLNLPMPYAVYPVLTLTPTGGSATKGKRQKRKRKKRKRKHPKRKRKTHGHGGGPFSFGSGKNPFLFGSTKDPFAFGSTKDPFGFGTPKSKGKRKKKKKRKGHRHKKKGKKAKKPPVVELTQRGGFTANVKHPKPNLAPLPLKHTASTRYSIEDNLFHRSRTHKVREHFRFRAGLIAHHRSAKLGNRHFRFRVGLEPKKRRQRRVRL